MSVLSGKKFLVVDVETIPGTNHDGHPFDPANKLYFIGAYDGDRVWIFDIEFTEKPYGERIKEFQKVLDSYDCIVAFNAKFDLHWLRRYGVKFDHKFIYDLQYGEFTLSGQKCTFKENSVDKACERRGIEGKIPFDHSQNHSEAEWIAYLHRDLICEYEIFKAQQVDLQAHPTLLPLIWWGSQDLKVTEQMEYNGILYDTEKSIKIGDLLLEKVVVMDASLFEICPLHWFNWSSPDNVSAILYGGAVSVETVESYTFKYKNGTTKEKLHKVDKDVFFPRLVEPLKNTEAKKNANEPEEKYHRFSTDEGVLRRLKAVGQAKQIISLLLARRELEKKVGTYYHGIPKLMEKMGWQGRFIHGQLNHCVAATGRLSSSKPNCQNLEAQMRQCIQSRFPLK